MCGLLSLLVNCVQCNAYNAMSSVASNCSSLKLTSTTSIHFRTTSYPNSSIPFAHTPHTPHTLHPPPPPPTPPTFTVQGCFSTTRDTFVFCSECVSVFICCTYSSVMSSSCSTWVWWSGPKMNSWTHLPLILILSMDSPLSLPHNIFIIAMATGNHHKIFY